VPNHRLFDQILWATVLYTGWILPKLHSLPSTEFSRKLKLYFVPFKKWKCQIKGPAHSCRVHATSTLWTTLLTSLAKLNVSSVWTFLKNQKLHPVASGLVCSWRYFMSSSYFEFVSGLRCLSSCSYDVPKLPAKDNLTN
jgi:hypothetical protein